MCLQLHLIRWMFLGESAVHTNLDLNYTGEWQKSPEPRWEMEFPILCQVCPSSSPWRGCFGWVESPWLVPWNRGCSKWDVSISVFIPLILEMEEESDGRATRSWWCRWWLRELMKLAQDNCFWPLLFFSLFPFQWLRAALDSQGGPFSTSSSFTHRCGCISFVSPFPSNPSGFFDGRWGDTPSETPPFISFYPLRVSPLTLGHLPATL